VQGTLSCSSFVGTTGAHGAIGPTGPVGVGSTGPTWMMGFSCGG
jgi:hypothetical protein